MEYLRSFMAPDLRRLGGYLVFSSVRVFGNFQVVCSHACVDERPVHANVAQGITLVEARDKVGEVVNAAL
eukprot:4130047-Amphidinium_carterae.2